MANPVVAITTCAGTALLIAVMTEGAINVGVLDLPDCDSFVDWASGCDNIVSRVMALIVLGTIPGAHELVNAFMGVLGLALRAGAIWGLANIRTGGAA